MWLVNAMHVGAPGGPFRVSAALRQRDLPIPMSGRGHKPRYRTPFGPRRCDAGCGSCVTIGVPVRARRVAQTLMMPWGAALISLPGQL